MSEHKHGTMDYEVQEKTFYKFIGIVKWTMILVVAFLVFLAIVNG